MNEIYWITRLTYICDFLTAVAVVSFLISVVTGFLAACSKRETYSCKKDSEHWNYCMKEFKMLSNYSKRFIFVTIIAGLINFFIPTTNEALMIYGVGGTIDYVKSNETAKQLPDKYIKALDKWVENLTKEENKKQNDNESK